MAALISVILPSFNHEHFVGIAIESVLNQSFTNFELIISDDCSSDGTAEVISGYQERDSRIKSHFFQSNQGATFNHKYLLDKAAGKYVALINSDDVWLPGKLESQVSYLEAHEDCAACFTWADFVDETGGQIDIGSNVFKQQNRTQAEWIEHFFTKGNCICHPSVLIRKSVYDELGVYNLALRQLPDFDMWIRVVKKFQIHIIEEKLVQHRRFINTGVNTSSPTISNSVRDVMESHFILSHYFDNMDDRLFIEGFKKHFRRKNAETKLELSCEKFFLMLDEKYYMPKIPLISAITFFLQIYDEPGIADTFIKKYHFSLQDFHKVSCKVDLLNLVPDVSFEGASNFNLESYIRLNRAKVIAAIFFNKNSKCYYFFKKIYLKICKIFRGSS